MADDEVLARAKFACPACGGEAVWNPTRQKLVCPFCGTESAATLPATGDIVEHDLGQALRGMRDNVQGWGDVDKREVRCQSCNAISVLEPARQAQNCPFCGSAQLVPYEETSQPFRPESVLPLKVAESDARDGIRRWYGKLWLAPGALKRRALTDTVKGVYLPYWTFDAQIDATWTADAGHYYTTTETFVENGQMRTRQVRQVRWEPASGQLSHFFDDDLVCASMGVRQNLLRAVEPFPTGELKPYDAGYVSGWVVERYQIDLVAATQAARASMEAQLNALCAAQVPGDTYRNLVVHPRYSAQTYKHILAPIWLLSYTYGARSFQCVMNGVSGAISGEYPKSPWKIALIVIAAIIALIIFASMGAGSR